MNLWQKIGAGIEKLGYTLGLPEVNISENIFGIHNPAYAREPELYGIAPYGFSPTPEQQKQIATGQVGSGGTTPGYLTAGKKQQSEIVQQYQEAAQSKSGGGSSGGSGEGGGGGADYGALISEMTKRGHTPETAMAAIQGQGYEALAREYGLLEAIPSEPQIDYDAIYAPAIEAYRNLIATLEASLPTTLQAIEAETGATIGGLERELASKTSEYEAQKREAETKVGEFLKGEEARVREAIGRGERSTESAIAEARRNAAEILQGIQARFGGTTGTGRFASELVGRQTLGDIAKHRTALTEYAGGLESALARTISENQANLQLTLGKIDDAIRNLNTQVTGKIADIQQQATILKQQARDALQERIAEINTKIGMLESQKSDSRLRALLEYRDRVAEVEARNKAFVQDLYKQAQQHQYALEQLKQQAIVKYQTSLQGLGNLPELALAAQRAGLEISPEAFSQLVPKEYQPILKSGGALKEKKKERDEEDILPDLTNPAAYESGQLGSILEGLPDFSPAGYGSSAQLR